MEKKEMSVRYPHVMMNPEMVRESDRCAENLAWDIVGNQESFLMEKSKECSKDDILLLHCPETKISVNKLNQAIVEYSGKVKILPLVDPDTFLNEGYKLGLPDEYLEVRQFFLRNRDFRDTGRHLFVVYLIEYRFINEISGAEFESFKCGAISKDITGTR